MDTNLSPQLRLVAVFGMLVIVLGAGMFMLGRQDQTTAPAPPLSSSMRPRRQAPPHASARSRSTTPASKPRATKPARIATHGLPLAVAKTSSGTASSRSSRRVSIVPRRLRLAQRVQAGERRATPEEAGPRRGAGSAGDHARGPDLRAARALRRSGHSRAGSGERLAMSATRPVAALGQALLRVSDQRRAPFKG